MWQLLLLTSQEVEYLRLSLPLGNGNKPGFLGGNGKSPFATVERCHPLSNPKCRNGNIFWGKILAKNPTKNVRSSQHCMHYLLHWVLCFLLSFTECLGFMLDFWKSFLRNPTLSLIFWSGWRQTALALLEHCLLKNGTAVLTQIHTILILFSRECVGLNWPCFASVTFPCCDIALALCPWCLRPACFFRYTSCVLFI